MGVLRASCVGLALAVLATPIHAQNVDASSPDLVSVNISDLQMVDSLARGLHVEVAQIPVMVQVPIQLAAGVCGVTVTSLRRNTVGGQRNCDATTTSPAFTTAVAEQLLEE